MWVVDPSRSTLSSEEIENGYDGPYASIELVLPNCTSGDKIRLHDGTYIISRLRDGENYIGYIPALHIQGIGKNVRIVQKLEMLTWCNSYIFENIYFESNINEDNIDEIVGIRQLWMKDCVINCNLLEIRWDWHHWGFMNCTFIGGTSPIVMTPGFDEHDRKDAGTLVIIGCKFIGQKANRSIRGCIEIDYSKEEEEELARIKSYWKSKAVIRAGILRCYGNIFENNSCVPMLEYNPTPEFLEGVEVDQNCILYHNLQFGANNNIWSADEFHFASRR